MKPTSFVDVVSGGATDGIKLSSPGYRWQELGDDITDGSLLKVFAESPPAEIVNFLQLFVGTVEPGNVLFDPIPHAGIGHCIGGELGISGIERINETSVRVRLQDLRRAVARDQWREEEYKH